MVEKESPIAEFPDEKGIFWKINSEKPDKILILACWDEPDETKRNRTVVKVTSYEPGYPINAEPTLAELLSFVDGAMQHLPYAAFTLRLAEYVSANLELRLEEAGITRIKSVIDEFIEKKTFAPTSQCS